MSGYGSKRAVRDVIIATLEKEGRNPHAYNIAGIMRDAFYDRGPGNGYSADSEEHWRTAVTEHRRAFGVGDLVRVVLEVDGLTEHHYGTIAQFRKANGGNYRGTPVKPHSAYVELMHHNGRSVPLAEITPALDDFEIVRDWSDVHQGAMNGDGYFRCLRCGGHSYKGAELMIVHKVSGQRVRLCNGCFNDDELAQHGHWVMFQGRNGRETVAELTENPKLVTGPADDHEAFMYRQWADLFAWLMPAEAAKEYELWKEQQRVSVAA